MTFRKKAAWVIAAGCVWALVFFFLFRGAGGFAAARPAATNTLAVANWLAESSNAENKGRFQIAISAPTEWPLGTGLHPLVIKLDTATGQAWTYESLLVSDGSTNASTLASGWQPVSSSFASNLSGVLSSKR